MIAAMRVRSMAWSMVKSSCAVGRPASDYVKQNKIGEGTFGVVTRAVEKSSGRAAAAPLPLHSDAQQNASLHEHTWGCSSVLTLILSLVG